MSLASSIQKFSGIKRQNLANIGKGSLMSKAMEWAGEEVAGAGAFVAEHYDVAEKKTAWESFEAGQKELGIESPQKPTFLQGIFKRPEDVFSQSVEAGGREYSAGEIKNLGALVDSDQKILYEKMAGGSLAQQYGKPIQEIAYNPEEGDAGEAGFKPGGVEGVKERKSRERIEGMWSPDLPSEAGKGKGPVTPGDYPKLDPKKTAELRTRDVIDVTNPNPDDTGLKGSGDNPPVKKLGLGGRLENMAFEEYLRSMGVQGQGLSNMVPGWAAMTKEDKDAYGLSKGWKGLEVK